MTGVQTCALPISHTEELDRSMIFPDIKQPNSNSILTFYEYQATPELIFKQPINIIEGITAAQSKYSTLARTCEK